MLARMHAAPTSPSLSVAPLWTRARAMFARAITAIGEPAAIAALRSMSAELRRRIIAWLCPLEHVVRKLLLAEAARLRDSESACAAKSMGVEIVRMTPPAWVRAITALARESAPEAARANRAAMRPATFSFALPRDPFAVAAAQAPRIRALCGDDPAPAPEPAKRAPRALDTKDAPQRLARRFEALRRVLDDPLAHALRLARVLARAARRFPDIARRCLNAPARTADYDPADPRLSVDAFAAALDAAETPGAFGDSS